MSASELSNRIESSSSSTVTVNAQPSYSSSHLSVSGGYYYQDSYHEDSHRDYNTSDGFANNRIAVARRSTLNIGLNNYNVYGGYEISFTGGDDAHQFRLALHGNRAEFQTNGTNGFNSPLLLGIDIDLHKLYPRNQLDFLLGLRITSAQLGYQLNKSVEIAGTTYDDDSLSVFGIGLPVGVQMDIGSFSLEAIASPTVYFHGFNTYLGFDNDIATTNFNVPISAGVGFNW